MRFSLPDERHFPRIGPKRCRTNTPTLDLGFKRKENLPASMAARKTSWSPQQRAEWTRENLPHHLKGRLEDLLGGREGLDRVLTAESRPSVRINPLKTTLEKGERALNALGLRTERIAWSPHSLFIDDDEDRPLGKTFEHQAGHLFMQDAASSLPVAALDPQPGERILDLCAAPGGKATHILARMGDQGLLVANDPKPQRVNHMVSTLDRLGGLSCIVTQRDGRNSTWPLMFDRVLVDAPCTTLGSIHHSPGAAFKQNRDKHERMAKVQRRLLLSAAYATRPGGTIIYSTCTLDPHENEEVVAWFAQQEGIALEPHQLPIKGQDAPEKMSDAARECAQATLRIHPGDHGTDGFFVARFIRLDGELDVPPNVHHPPTKPPRSGQAEPELAGRAPIDEVIEHTGLDPEPLAGTNAVITNGRIWATRIDTETLKMFLPLVPTRIGQQLASRETPGPRLHFDAATRFGTNAQDPIRLRPEDARAWLAGETIRSPAGAPTDRHRILECNGQVVGAARAYGEKMPSFVPKHRRVPDEDRLHGWLARQATSTSR